MVGRSGRRLRTGGHGLCPLHNTRARRPGRQRVALKSLFAKQKLRPHRPIAGKPPPRVPRRNNIPAHPGAGVSRTEASELGTNLFFPLCGAPGPATPRTIRRHPIPRIRRRTGRIQQPRHRSGAFLISATVLGTERSKFDHRDQRTQTGALQTDMVCPHQFLRREKAL